MEAFIRENIEHINSRISDFKEQNPNDTQIKNFLKDKFFNELPGIKEDLIQRFRDNDYVKARIKDIANQFILYKTDLEKFYTSYLYQEILSRIDNERLVANIQEFIKDELDDVAAYRFIKNDFSKLSEKLSILLKLKGFSSNLLGINDGIMLANSGDSAQFLFLSRGILAGFNCSNVDVRSSRYDSVIDYDGKLLKVQVKGISDNKISFKDRDRGGQGIDHTHERNIGQIITSEDCDIYVAVDKQCGICYIIPMAEFVDPLPDTTKTRPMNVSELVQFRENWDVIKEVAER